MQRGIVTIQLDERWDLKDFAIFSKEYLQVYDFFYSLRALSQSAGHEMIRRPLPWKGGYSVVNFFYALSGKVHPLDKPVVKKIQYASPGVIELQEVVQVAQDISLLVGYICASVTSVATTYHLIKKNYLARELSRIEIEEAKHRLDQSDTKFIIDSVKTLHESFGLNDDQILALDSLSSKDKLIQLKILLSLYRRVEPLVELQQQNKAKFIPPNIPD